MRLCSALELSGYVSSLKRCTLTGQFSTEPEATVYDVHEGVDPLKKKATMEVKGHKLGVTRYLSLNQK